MAPSRSHAACTFSGSRCMMAPLITVVPPTARPCRMGISTRPRAAWKPKSRHNPLNAE